MQSCEEGDQSELDPDLRPPEPAPELRIEHRRAQDVNQHGGGRYVEGRNGEDIKNYRDEGDYGRVARDYLRSTLAVSAEKMHHGHADERGGDYFGPALNRTARLMSAGHGGQVLLSQTAQLVVRDYLPEGVDLRDLGEHRLKDLRHSEHLFQLVAPGLADVVMPPVTAEAVTARDRVQVLEDAPTRPLPETMAALLAQ